MSNDPKTCTCHARRYGERELVIILPPPGSAIKPFGFHRGCPRHGVTIAEVKKEVDEGVSQ